MMTRDDLINLINWNDIGIGTCRLYLKLFEKEVLFTFICSDVRHPKISEKMFETLTDVLKIEADQLDLIKDLLWDECIFAFQVADYGCIPNEGETHLQAHLREFGIESREDAYQKSELMKMEILISCDSDNLAARYAEIQINSASDNLISIIVKNGEIIDFDDNGTYLGQFEDESTFARVKRNNVLSKM